MRSSTSVSPQWPARGSSWRQRRREGKDKAPSLPRIRKPSRPVAAMLGFSPDAPSKCQGEGVASLTSAVPNAPFAKASVTAATSSTPLARDGEAVMAPTLAMGPSRPASRSTSWTRLIQTGPPPAWARQPPASK